MNIPIRTAILFFVVGMAASLSAQTLSNLGAVAPTPGTNDISQLSTQGNTTWPDTLNYFTDNETGHGSGEPGQTFTTGTNATGYVLTSVAVRTGGIGTSSGTTTLQPYYLHLYLISGSTASLVQTFVSGNLSFNDGDWLNWTGLSVQLAANSTYAYSFGKASSTAGWEPMAVATNKYAGGEIALIPVAGGAINTGGSHSFDAVFNLGLQLASTNPPPSTNPPSSTPLPMPTYGFNLGNSLEAVWGFTYPTAAALNTAAASGFNAVRIPVAWHHNATTNISGGVTNYPINPVFMAKVKQTVDYALAAGMHVVMNDHWDDGWMENNIGSTVDPTINAKMNSFWSQIATTFAGYDNRLLFAGANEPNVHNPAEMKTLMFYYQTFVNAVRGAGGYNTNRWLVIQAGGDTLWLNALPTDTVTNRIMVEYHNYTPSLFTIIHTDQSWGDAIYFWGPAYHSATNLARNASWGQEGDIDAGFQTLADLYVSKGIPVMIGEFGAYPTAGLNATETTWNKASTLYWDKYVAESARAHGLSPFFWSTPGNPINFTTGAINDAQVVSALTGGTAPPPPNGAPYAPTNFVATGGSGQIVLSWNAVSGATSYNLHRSAESGSQSATPDVTGITGTNYTDTGLNSGTTYYYRLAAVNASGVSGFAPEAKATTSGVNPDPTQYHFETDPQGWYGGGGIISGVTNSTVQKYAGQRSLAVNFNSAAAGNSSVTLNNAPVPAGATVTFRVWIPSGHKISTIEPIAQDYNWGWAAGWYGSFTANAWNTLALTVPSTATIPLQRLNLRFTTSAGWTNTCYVDSISWNGVTPDFNLAVSPANLTVNGGTNGTSLITVTATNGLNAAYTLSVSNLPSGVSATFTNNPNIGGQSLLTLTASNTVTPVTTNVTVIATAGLISHTKTIALTLTGPTNAPPTLAPIANQTVNVAQTVAFSANATDTNQPPQTLTFSLLAGSGSATLNPSSGAFSWTPQVSDAGSISNLFTIKVADDGSPSLSATNSFYVTVNKQIPVLTAPVASAIAYGQTLAGSILSGGAATNAVNNAAVAGSFAFTTPATAPGVGTASQAVIFTPTDTAHYSNATINVSVTVNKQTPVLTAPVATAITYGQTLASSTLSGGTATNAANNASVAGSFAFTTPATTPSAGTANQSVTFTPADTAHYNPAMINVSVTVNQTSPALAFSSSKNPSGYSEDVIFTASLPADATGNVSFRTNGALFAVAALNSGSAAVTNNILPTGTNLITAVYLGDDNYLGFTNTLNQVVTNAPPVLAAISDYTVNVGQTVAFTAGATDVDAPSQTLAFALLAGATNATLDTNSGAFSFRPLVTQANSTNNFTLKVSDSGVPSLSATQSFAVVVNSLAAPAVSSLSMVGGQFSLSINGQSGPDYAVEVSTNLTQWSTAFITNSPALPFSWTDTNSAMPQRFYRIKLGPPLP